MSRLGRRVKHVKSEVISHARFVELKYYSEVLQRVAR